MKNGDTPANPLTWKAIIHNDGLKIDDCYGLTKREQFAMAAIQGLASSAAEYSRFHEMAKDAVAIADALLAELEKSK